MKHDQLADMFAIIKSAEAIGKKECIVPFSKIGKAVLKIMQNHKYISDFDIIEDGKGGKFKVKLLGNINDCRAIKPRFCVKKNEFIKWEKRFLPAANTGILIVSTTIGIVDQKIAKQKGIGGVLLAYVY
jgi:small subunit ribosomal protein S8